MVEERCEHKDTKWKTTIQVGWRPKLKVFAKKLVCVDCGETVRESSVLSP